MRGESTDAARRASGGRPAWADAAQDSVPAAGEPAAGGPDSAATEGGVVESSGGGLKAWWDAQEAWQLLLYGLGLVAVCAGGESLEQRAR